MIYQIKKKFFGGLSEVLLFRRRRSRGLASVAPGFLKGCSDIFSAWEFEDRHLRLLILLIEGHNSPIRGSGEVPRKGSGEYEEVLLSPQRELDFPGRPGDLWDRPGPSVACLRNVVLFHQI